MKLRWYVELNQYGQRTKPELQFLDDDREWQPINIEEVKVESDTPLKGDSR